MRTTLLSTAALCVSLVALAMNVHRAGDAQVAPASPTAPNPQPNEPVERWLVWSADGTPPRPSTVAVETDDAGERVVGRYDGLAVAVGTDVYRATFATRSVLGVDCLCAMDVEDRATGPGEVDLRPCARVMPGREPRLVSSSGAVLEIGRIDDRRAVEGARGHDDHSLTARWTGGAGPLLTVNVCEHSYHCGAAHGDTQCTRTAWDLRTGLPWVEPTVRDRALASVPPADAAAGLRHAETDEPVDLARGRPVSPWPSPAVDPDGAFVWRHQLAFDDCYACSDDLWNSYTSSILVDHTPADGPPPGLEPPPAPVLRAAIDALDGARVAGWSRYEGDAWPPPGFLASPPASVTPPAEP